MPDPEDFDYWVVLVPVRDELFPEGLEIIKRRPDEVVVRWQDNEYVFKREKISENMILWKINEKYIFSTVGFVSTIFFAENEYRHIG